MSPWYPEVAARAMHRCEYCHAPECAFNFPFEVEHIHPTSQGGASETQNLALACRACNLKKGKKTGFEDPLTAEQTALFSPRAQVWEQHFAADTVSAEIRGLTANGRATADCLQLNTESQRVARILWTKLGLFP